MIPLMVLRADPRDSELLGRIAGHLEGGGLLAYPTETVYGLGGAVDARGVKSLRALKGREEDKPFLVLLPPASEDDGEGEEGDGWGLEWNSAARALARRFWPGPLTLVLPDPRRRFPQGVQSASGGVGVRRSPEPFVEALLARWRRPLLSTSANRPGEPPARTGAEVKKAVEGRPGLHRLWIADGGPLIERAPSTVVDCTGSGVRIVRVGEIPPRALRETVPNLEEDEA